MPQRAAPVDAYWPARAGLNYNAQPRPLLPDGPIMPKKKPKLIKPPAGDYYQAVETARGSFGVRLVSDGTKNPYRMKLRSPTYSNMHLFDEACRGMMIMDALAFMGSLDLVIPEMDR